MRPSEALEQRLFFAVDYLAVGADVGSPPRVRVYDAETLKKQFDFNAYDSKFKGGVRVAVGDVNGDGTPDIITGAGAGAPGGHVKVFDGTNGALLQSFFAFDPAFSGGVTVAAGDVNNDTFDDIIVGAGPGGGPHVKVFSGKDNSTLNSFFAFGSGFAGGVNVASGHVDRDDFADIIVGAGPGAAGGHVKVFSGGNLSELKSFLAFDPNFTGGVYVAAGDVNGDGLDDIIVGAGRSVGGHVKVFDAIDTHLISSFFTFNEKFDGAVRVAAADVNGDGIAELIVANAEDEKPQVRIIDALTGELIDKFKVKGAHKNGGAFVG